MTDLLVAIQKHLAALDELKDSPDTALFIHDEMEFLIYELTYAHNLFALANGQSILHYDLGSPQGGHRPPS